MNRTSKILAFALQAIFLSTPVFAAMESDGVVADGGCMNENSTCGFRLGFVFWLRLVFWLRFAKHQHP
jgi:hypothetical protein